MSDNVVVIQVTTLFLIMAVGFYARKRSILSKEVTNGLTELLLNITVPFTIVNSFNMDFSRGMLINAGVVLICSIFIHAFSLLFGKIIYRRYPVNTRTILVFISVFSNCGFMGFPVLQSLFGTPGVFYGSIYVVGYTVFVWTAGVMLFTSGREAASIRKVLLNPGIVAVLVGLVIFVFSLKLPVPLFNTLDLVGAMTVPLSMLIVGSMLAEMRIREVLAGSAVYLGTVVRLIIIPLLTFTVLKLVGLNDLILEICVLLAAMPAATLTAMFAERYNGDSALASRLIFTTTVLSMVTLPLMILLVKV